MTTIMIVSFHVGPTLSLWLHLIWPIHQLQLSYSMQYSIIITIIITIIVKDIYCHHPYNTD